MIRLLKFVPANSVYTLGCASWGQLSNPIRIGAFVLVEALVVVKPVEKAVIGSLLWFLVASGTRTLKPCLSQVLAANQLRKCAQRSHDN